MIEPEVQAILNELPVEFYRELVTFYMTSRGDIPCEYTDNDQVYDKYNYLLGGVREIFEDEPDKAGRVEEEVLFPAFTSINDILIERNNLLQDAHKSEAQNPQE